MKKLFCIMLAGLMLLSATACDRRDGGSSTPPPSGPSVNDSQAVPPPPDPAPAEPGASGTRIEYRPTMSTNLGEIEILAADSVLWGWGPHVDEHNRSLSCMQLQEKYGKYNAFFIAPDDNKFYLTFDEGYENGYTAQILDVLKEKNVPSVFFVTLPYAKQNPELIQRMIDEGHMVGNHSCTHPDFTKISLEKAYEEVKGLHDYMLETYDYTMSVFRYPTGAFNEQTLAMLDQMGYRTAFWSFGYADWDQNNQLGREASYKKVVEGAHPGAIYLLHAVSKDNAELLGDFIEHLHAQGYVLSEFDLHKDILTDAELPNDTGDAQE